VLRYYFIDMELGAFTLEDYIRSHFTSTELGFDWNSLQATTDRSLVQRNCSPIARLENWCTIGAHITSGLKYMHSHRYVHRDLKPANGSY
jgi:serine/threonine protein kinase